MRSSPHRKTPSANPPNPIRPILPFQRLTNGTPPHQMPPRPSLLNRPPPWAGAPSLKVQLKGLPQGWGTFDIYKVLSGYGSLDRVEIFEQRPTHGYAIFRPPPPTTQWLNSALIVMHSGSPHRIDCQLDLSRQNSRSDTEPEAPPPTVAMMTQLDTGIMQQKDCMLTLFTAQPAPEEPLEASVITQRNTLEIRFGKHVSKGGEQPVAYYYKLCISLAQIQHACELSSSAGEKAILVTLEKPPVLFRKANDIGSTHFKEASAWNESQTWFRQTGISEHSDERRAVTKLQNEAMVLDIGRWLTYRLTFSTIAADYAAFVAIGRALIDHNVSMTSLSRFTNAPGKADDLWTWSEDLEQATGSGSNASLLSALHMMVAPLTQLDFNVRYQLEVCLSNGVLNESNMHAAFVQKLASSDATRMARVLEKAADSKERIWNPMDIFRLQSQVSMRSKKIPRYCAMVPAAVVTPSTLHFTTPVMEISNRVIREYRQYGDRFLRVKFTDERYRGRILVGEGNTTNEVLTRIYRTMTNGIRIGDRHYEFLAFGNSQFREHGAYFFAATGSVTAEKIRQWMGNFTKIQVVAKYASRIGQCFSTTRAMSIGVKIEPIPDIERNGFCFTDGVGKISSFLAQMIAEEYSLPNTSTEYPSVFQFRLGGCKGVLVVDSALKGQVVQIRPSQEKFPAKYKGLEICRISQYSSANLNVQIILVLSALGVEDWVFIDMMQRALAELNAAMTDERKATEQLCRNIDFSQTTLTIADMIYDGFMRVADPFMISCLRLWRSWMIKYLKEKARIPVEQGAFILGCVDETATLKGHYASSQAPGRLLNDPTVLPEIFLQISDPEMKGSYKIMQGICVLARNPSLHPGDVRVVRAVDAPKLRHLKDCVVLPQTGDRDLANMCSGGDLDGDDYLVIWDSELIPKEWDHPPMDYNAPPPVVSKGPVTVDDMTSFFVTHMKNDNLGRIAMAHRYWADNGKSCREGVKDEKCLELAQLHSKAVDYAKTGVPAEMPKRLRPREYPHWAETKGKRTYHSHRVLGQLYDAVQTQDFEAAWSKPFDKRILKEARRLDERILQDALEVKQQYDEAIRRVMSQHGIKSEFEVWTTFVLEHNSDIGDYKFAETLSETVSAAKDCHKELCYEKAGTSARERDWSKMAPFIAAMYAVTAREVETACAANSGLREIGGQRQSTRQSDFDNMPFMSFPWIFAKELGHIANGRIPSADTMTTHAMASSRKLASKTPNPDHRGDSPEPLPEIILEDSVVHENDLLNVHHKGDSFQLQAEVTGDENMLETVMALPSGDTATSSGAVADDSPQAGFARITRVRSMEQQVEDGADGIRSLSRIVSARKEADEDEEGPASEEDDETGGEEVILDAEEQPSKLDDLQKMMGL